MTGHCTDCEEYDQKSHSCPKFCEVITETVKELREESIPIEFIQKKIDDIRQYLEKQTMETVMSYEINVDKDELVKALAYDRRQYDLGYADGKMDANAELIRCKDCKWYAHCDDCYGDCMKEGAVNGFVYTNDYCSRAEPKETEE